MKQKLGLACALLRPPRLLLLDEPTVGVDPLSRRELWRMVLELKAKGIGILWSTAYLDEAEKCDTVLLLNDGLPLFVGRPSELMDRVSTRTFSVSSGPDRRAAMSEITKQSDVIDASFEGSQIRVLISDLAKRPGTELPRTIALQPRAARFEDGFMALLGGMHKEPCRLDHSSDANSGRENDIRVEAIDLTRRFGSFTAADHVSFAIKRGEIFGLIGPNGAGKSTVFKMLCGLLRPTSGRALVDGLDLAKAPGAARARLGYMAQRFSLYGDLSVRQNLEFFARTYGIDRAHLRSAIDNAIDALNLKEYVTTNAGTLPLGFKQRLALACAIIHQPRVLFLDEPTSGVDPITRRDFWFHIDELATRGVTVLVTTHFLDEAEYCDRMALIYRGRVIAADTPAQIREYGRAPDRPSPTLDDAFTSLVAAYDRKQAA
jgi:ABC-type multidrug transport system ATPase subunit